MSRDDHEDCGGAPSAAAYVRVHESKPSGEEANVLEAKNVMEKLGGNLDSP